MTTHSASTLRPTFAFDSENPLFRFGDGLGLPIPQRLSDAAS